MSTYLAVIIHQNFKSMNTAEYFTLSPKAKQTRFVDL